MTAIGFKERCSNIPHIAIGIPDKYGRNEMTLKASMGILSLLQNFIVHPYIAFKIRLSE